MTDHPTPFDPAAFLSECARVHEAGEKTMRSTRTLNALKCANAARAVDSANRMRRETYAALLDVARGLVNLKADALRQMGADLPEDVRFSAFCRHTVIDALLAPLSRLAAAGGGR